VEGTPFGRYRLVELLGRGGMGEVWRAHDTVTKRTVALKVLLESFAYDKRFISDSLAKRRLRRGSTTHTSSRFTTTAKLMAGCMSTCDSSKVAI
jgi:serine/threonine protein kinase